MGGGGLINRTMQQGMQAQQQALPQNLQGQEPPPGTGGIKAPMQDQPQQMIPEKQAYTGGGGKGGGGYGGVGGVGGQYGGAWPGQGYGGMPGRFGGGMGGPSGYGYGSNFGYGGGGRGFGMGGFPMGNQYGPGSYGGYPGSMGYGGGSGMRDMMYRGPFSGGYDFNQGAQMSAGYPGQYGMGGGYTGGGGKGGGGGAGMQPFDPMNRVNADFRARESALAKREASAAREAARRREQQRRQDRQFNRGSCFIAGTLVEMDGQDKRIEDVRIGDKLLGRGGVYNEVLAFDHPKLGDRLLYSINGGKFFVTAEHPFATTTGWKSFDPAMTREENPHLEVMKLEIGDELQTFSGTEVLKTISITSDHPKTPLYNFKLGGDNTYYADRYLVHNKQ